MDADGRRWMEIVSHNLRTKRAVLQRFEMLRDPQNDRITLPCVGLFDLL